MLLILTHENADFDAVASQLCASKLYPEGVPLLPRRINRNVGQFLTLYWDVLPFVRPEEWKRKRVDKVLIVDSHTVNSVRGMVRHPEVSVIDHHVGHEKHESWTYQVDAVGATTTILVEMLQSAGLGVTAEEATLLLLGVYEDTGSLTYATTTARDIRAAACLLDFGAELSVMRRFLNVALTSEQRELYDQLEKAATWIELSGHSMVVAAAAAPDGFDEEISSIAHRLRDALSPVALFVLVEMHGDVQLVARSATSYVDVSEIARALGGGGHDRAAAAMVVGRSLADVEKQVVSLLPQAVRPMATVSHIMSYGVQTLLPSVTVAEAASVMKRFGYEGYPVVDTEKNLLVGLLTRRAVDRAVSHDLGHLTVSRVMKAGSVMVRPSDSIERVQELMLEEGWGQVPVVEEGWDEQDPKRLLGIVTRTDVLSFLFKPSPKPSETDMRQLLIDSVSPALWEMLLAVSAMADSLRMPLYFVGGVVRDLLLQNQASDLDMVVEGDAIGLVSRLQVEFGGEFHAHERFGTAKWLVTPRVWQAVAPEKALDGVPKTIDFVTARTEFYTEPSALPEVERGSIKLDLHRRDFTINTLAVRLDGLHLGELLDFYGGRRDLEQGTIRVLHSLSFIDDPTRIVRAIRLEQRLGFRIEPRTAELIALALPMLDRVTGSRIRHEVELALQESSPARTMERMDQLNVLTHIHPGLRWETETKEAFARVPQVQDSTLWRSLIKKQSLAFIYFALWVAPLPEKVRREVMERLRVRKATREDVDAISRLLNAMKTTPPDAQPSNVAKMLRPYSPRVLVVARIWAGDNPSAHLLERYYGKWRFVGTVISGADLRRAGLKPGPEFAIILDRLLAAKLDGEIHDESGERALLAEILANREPELEVPRRVTDKQGKRP
jgi:tRNA nucleotidyltransferase (CCA-adding enzyme)